MKILYVEDEAAHVELTQRTLEDNLQDSFVLYHAESFQEALKILATESDIDLVLTDLRLPDGSGLDLLKRVKELPFPPAVVLVTGQGDEQIAVTALKAGAADYLVKEGNYLNRLPPAINNAVAQNQLGREQAALRAAEHRFRVLVEQLPAAVYTSNHDELSSAQYISPQIREISGFTAEEWLANPNFWLTRLHPDDVEAVLQTIKTTYESLADFNVEYRIIHQDGSVVWVRDVAKAILDENGIPQYWQGILFDITKEVEAQATLKASEERFRRIFHSTPIPTCVVTVDDGQFIDANQAFQNLVGVSLENLIGRTSVELGFWQSNLDREIFMVKLKEQGSIKGIDIRYANVPNGPRDTLGFYEPIELGGAACLLSMFYDVTEQNKTQKALQAERDFALQVLNNMGQGLTVVDKTGRFEYVNPAYAGMIGYTVEDLINKTPSDITASDHHSLLTEQQSRRLNGIRSTYESNLVHSNGHEVPVVITGVPRLQNGELNGSIAVVTDLTVQKQTEQALERQVKELTALHAVATAEAESLSEDEVIQNVTLAISQIYSEICGVLLLDRSGTILTPHSSYIGADISNWRNGYPVTDGVTGKSVTTGKIIRLGNITNESGYIEIATGVKSELCVPIRVHERVIGVINVESKSADIFTGHDEDFLITVASGLGTALERLRLFDEEQRRANVFAALYATSSKLTSKWDLQGLLETVLAQAMELLNTTGGGIYLYDATLGDLDVAVARGIIMRPGIRLQMGEGMAGRVALSKKPIIVDDYEKWAERSDQYANLPIRAVVEVPMLYGGELIGVLAVLETDPSTRKFTESDAELLSLFAAQAATAIENTRLSDEEGRRTKIIEAMAEIANEIATTREIIPILDKITQRALELLRANNTAIYLLHDDNNTIKVISAQGVHRQHLLARSLRIGEGITGIVVANAKAEIINNMSEDHRKRQVPGTPKDESEFETMMSAPLLLRGKCIGAINAWRRHTDGLFNQTELNFLIGIGNQVSIALESGKLFQETIRRGQEAAAIAEVGRDISSTLQLDTVLERIATYAKDLLYADTSAVFLTDPTKPILRAIAAVGDDAKEIKNDPIELGKGILGNIVLHKVGEVVNYTINDPRSILVRDTEFDPNEHIIGVPILSKDQHTGLIAVWRSGRDKEFLQTDLEFLNSLAQQAATAIENARLYNETQLRLNDLEVINRISTALRSTKSIEEMLPIFLDETLKLLQSEHGSLWLYDAARDELVQRVARGFPIEFKTKRIKTTEGIIGHVFSSGNIHVSEEFLSDPLLFTGNIEQTPPGLGGICVPIQSTAGSVGAILIEMDKSKQTTNQTGLLTTLAEIAGNAIHRAELFEQSQEQIKRLTTLRDIDSAIASSTDLRVTLNILMDHTLKHLKTDAADIMLYHPELQSLTYLCSAGFNNPSPSRPLMRLGEGLAGQVVMKGGIEHVADLRISNEVKRDPMLIREGFVTYFGVPLIVKGQIKGVFEIFHRVPFTPTAEWMQFLQTLAGQAAIAIDNSQLFEHLQRSNQEVTQAYDTTLEGWARALELRDRETEGHTRRVTELTMQLARYMRISDDELINIYRGVLLHDIGKMGVPDQILRKTGPLIESEWVEMRKHPEYAFNLLAPIPYLRPALDIPYCHHEHWDGSGYPRGLKGEQIPLSARIFSIVDIWDALLSDRSYRKAWHEEKVIQYLKDISGKILDPNVVNEFFRMMNIEK